MRGEDQRSGGLFSYVDPEARLPADHPLRSIRTSFRGTARVGWSFTLAAAASDLICLPKLLAAVPRPALAEQDARPAAMPPGHYSPEAKTMNDGASSNLLVDNCGRPRTEACPAMHPQA